MLHCWYLTLRITNVSFCLQNPYIIITIILTVNSRAVAGNEGREKTIGNKTPRKPAVSILSATHTFWSVLKNIKVWYPVLSDTNSSNSSLSQWTFKITKRESKQHGESAHTQWPNDVWPLCEWERPMVVMQFSGRASEKKQSDTAATIRATQHCLRTHSDRNTRGNIILWCGNIKGSVHPY